MPGFDNNTMFANNVDFTGASDVTPQMVLDGQLLIGSTVSPNIKSGFLTSSDNTIGITNTSGNIDIKLSSSIKITTYITDDTWIKDARTKYIELILIGGGGAGGSGRQGASTTAGGGAGGAGASITYFDGPENVFPDSVSVIPAKESIGGLPQSANDTDGLNGSVGNSSFFGTLPGYGGDFGNRGVNGNASGGSTPYGRYLSSANAIGPVGGQGRVQDGFPPTSLSTALSSSGGGGGGADSVTIRSGGNSSDVKNILLSSPIIITGASGGIESGIINGSNGLNSVDLGYAVTTGAGGGGGGGQSAGPVAGNGGNGGFPGGGGGGGGGSLNGTNSGSGGNGAAGKIIVIEYF